MYKISVIVPVYKKQEQLPLSLESLAAQTVFEGIQLILVDDGSPDDCGKICDEFASGHENTVVIHRENGGVSAARNSGLDAATGEYVGFVDADDTLAPDYFENLLCAAEKFGCDMAFGSMTLIWAGEKRPGKLWYKKDTVLDKAAVSGDFARHMLSDGSQNTACTKLIRRSVIENNGIRFPAGVKIGEDKRFVLQLLPHISSAVCTGEKGYFYLDVPTSAMHSGKKMQELLANEEEEIRLFTALGLDEKIVREEKAAFLFYELADFLQRSLIGGISNAYKAIRLNFKSDALMQAVDPGLAFVKKNNGKIYGMLASAFETRSKLKTLFVLLVQKAINERNSKR